jgi:hypothetical protein
MKRFIPVALLLIVPALLMPGVAVSASAPEIIAITPYPVGSSGWIEYDIKANFTGDLDVFWGADLEDGLTFSDPQLWDSELLEWVPLSNMIEIDSSYLYSDVNTWSVMNIGYVLDTEVYKFRIWVEFPWTGLNDNTGSYIFGFKQESLTLRASIDDGTAYYISTPWYICWDNAIEVVFNNGGEEINNRVIELSLDADDIDWLNVQDDGDDIRFIDNDNTAVLNYKIVDWDYGESATFWVIVPTIEESSDYDSIILYYGNYTATAGSGSELTDPLTISYNYRQIGVNPPTNLDYEVLNDNCVLLSWDKGLGTHNTYIVRKLGTYPISISDGTLVYYGPESDCIDTGIEMGLFPNLNTYYYRAWSENVLGEVSTGYTQKEVTGIMTALLFTLGISAFAFWKRDVWLYIIAAIAVFFFAAQLFEINIYIAIAPFILSLYMIIRAATAWYSSRRD